MKKILAGCVGLFFTFLLMVAQANPNNPLNTPEEEQLRIKARKRLYPGGQDHENLKVQSQLAVPTRKMTPTTENPTEVVEPPAEDHD